MNDLKMFGERRLGRIGERLAGLLACVALSTTALGAERRSSREDTEDTEHTEEATEARDSDMAAAPAGETDEGKSKMGPARELMILGGVITGLGVAGLAVGIAGVAIGQAKQKEADAKELPEQQDEVDKLDDEGARANKMALAGFVVGGGLAAVGVILLAVGGAKKKRERATREARIHVAPMGLLGGSGVVLQGRF